MTLTEGQPATLTARRSTLRASKPKMSKFIIEGGVPLSGTIRAAGNKNAALPILAACLLTDDEVVLHNVPRIADVDTMLGLLELLGARVNWLSEEDRVVAVDASTVSSTEVDRQLAAQIRASFLLAGPLLARFGHAKMPPPGGDVIGRRRLDPHLDAFRHLGATVVYGDEIEVKAPPLGLHPCDFLMDESSVMATENALMAAALTRGTTVIRNAASEPHVQDLARMLVAMGAPIDGIGSNVMTVHGTGQLRGCTHTIVPDHIEIGSFMALAGVTGGELIVKDTIPEDLRMIRLAFARLGLRSEVQGSDVIVPGDQTLRIRNDAGEHTPKIQDGPWPAFPADLTSIAVALATQSEGSVIIHEWMFENRLVFTDKLQLMGAAITICDPHRAIVVGARRLRGQRVDSPDIRAGMAMLIAALCADGVTQIGNVRHIDKGYERIDERLRELGARIERVQDTART
jgi:UDP-N-acetylglucosamine 1-carboxyvinyltransferase